ncbi:MAG: sensor histidine kinase [Pseudomonadota bacterium]
MAKSDKHHRKFASLQAQTIAVLTLALVPLGALSILQSDSALSAADDAVFAALTAQTAEAAAPEREAITAASSAARTMAAALQEIGTETAACTALAKRMAEESLSYTFVGFSSVSLLSTCNNFDRPYDFSDDAAAQDLIAKPESDVSFVDQGAASGAAVIVVSEPAWDANGDLLGLVSISFPTDSLQRETDGLPVEFITFNELGEILTSTISEGRLGGLIPSKATLMALAGGGEQVFAGQSVNGEARKYAVTPIVEERAYALGVWLPVEQPRLLSFLVPGLMWLVTLLVALYALRGQVIHPVTSLRHRMGAFANRREIRKDGFNHAVPREFHEISNAFDDMAQKIVEDENVAEERLYERGLLLQELHHRVSNNLQIISSILNMELRKAQDTPTSAVLTGIQGRVSSISRFHQALYHTDFDGTLDAAPILEDIIDGLVLNFADLGLRLHPDLHIDPMNLGSDAAVNLSLYVFEAASYAGELMVRSDAKEGSISVSSDGGAGTDDLTITLTASPVGEGSEDMLGHERLIAAFAAQLRGTVTSETVDGVHTRRLSIPANALTGAGTPQRY